MPVIKSINRKVFEKISFGLPSFAKKYLYPSGIPSDNSGIPKLIKKYICFQLPKSETDNSLE